MLSRQEQEQQQDQIPLLFEVTHLTENRLLYLGNLTAANNPETLLAHNITSTLNVAVNKHPESLILENKINIRRTQIGLIDGNGNHVHQLLAAVLALNGLIYQASPGKIHYPHHKVGNVLVHCRGGRSRSIAVLAIWLCVFKPNEFLNIDNALEYLRTLRGIDNTYPTTAMLELINKVMALPLLKRLA